LCSWIRKNSDHAPKRLNSCESSYEARLQDFKKELTVFHVSRQGAVDVLEGRGPLNSDSTETVRELLARCIAHGQPRVVFSLEDVPLLDSAGLELLLDARDQCRQRGGTLALAAPNSLCRDILHVTGLDRSIDLHEDVLTAVGSFVG